MHDYTGKQPNAQDENAPQPKESPNDFIFDSYHEARDNRGRVNPKDDRIGGLWTLSEVQAYLRRIHATPRTLKSACIQEGEGKYTRNIATIRFEVGTDKPFAVFAKPDEFAPTDAEQKAMAEQVIGLKLPEQTPPARRTNGRVIVPKFLQEADNKDLLFHYRDLNGDLIAFEERGVDKNGNKTYHWWTPYSDGWWRNLEPEDGLPLYGMEMLRECSSTVILCEGAKAARAIRQDKWV